MKIYRPIIFLILSVLLVHSTEAQSARPQTVKILFDFDMRKSGTVRSFDAGGIVYVSVVDLASSLNIGVTRAVVTRKVELHLKSGRIKLTPSNPFIVISTDNGGASVVQFPFPVIERDSMLYVPVVPTIPILDQMTEFKIHYEPLSRIIRVQSPVKTSGPDIAGIDIGEKLNGVLVRLIANRRIRDFEGLMSSDGWYTITVGSARGDLRQLNAAHPVGVISKIEATQRPTSLQVKFKLNGPISTTELFRDRNSNDILLTLHTSERTGKSPPPHSELEQKRNRWNLDVLVIDAGHGGKDPGAIGVSGTKEKDITLAIAKRFGSLVAKNLKNVKVIYTRSTDKFVELSRRGQIANESGGKLFVSIHCNSTPRKRSPAHGYEIYMLRPGRKQEAIEIAQRENSVIHYEVNPDEKYDQKMEEEYILVTLAQKSYGENSERFADYARREMSKALQPSAVPVRQAGFYVLVGASMPNVLVETGYLSNPKEEKFLRSTSGQQKIAEALFRAVKDYQSSYTRSLTHEPL